MRSFSMVGVAVWGVACAPLCAQSELVEAPPIRRFSQDLVVNLAALTSKDNLAPLLVGGLLTGASAIPEQNVENYFRRRSPGLDSVSEPGAVMGTVRVVGGSMATAFVVSRLIGRPRFQRTTYELAQGLVINTAITGSTKELVRRTRPDGYDRRSFPSGHTSTSFVWATVLQRNYGWKVGAPAYLAASYVGASRLGKNVHHLTDIVAGASIGYIVGRTVTRSHHNGPRRVNWTVAPVRGGAVGGLAIQLGRVR